MIGNDYLQYDVTVRNHDVANSVDKSVIRKINMLLLIVLKRLD